MKLGVRCAYKGRVRHDQKWSRRWRALSRMSEATEQLDERERDDRDRAQFCSRIEGGWTNRTLSLGSAVAGVDDIPPRAWSSMAA